MEHEFEFTILSLTLLGFGFAAHFVKITYRKYFIDEDRKDSG